MTTKNNFVRMRAFVFRETYDKLRREARRQGRPLAEFAGSVLDNAADGAGWDA